MGYEWKMYLFLLVLWQIVMILFVMMSKILSKYTAYQILLEVWQIPTHIWHMHSVYSKNIWMKLWMSMTLPEYDMPYICARYTIYPQCILCMNRVTHTVRFILNTQNVYNTRVMFTLHVIYHTNQWIANTYNTHE